MKKKPTIKTDQRHLPATTKRNCQKVYKPVRSSCHNWKIMVDTTDTWIGAGKQLLRNILSKYQLVCNYNKLIISTLIYILVSSVKDAVDFCDKVHKEVNRGRSVNDALRGLHKDRKSLDRFKHIYYMKHCRPGKLKEVSVQHTRCFRGWVTPNMHRFYIILTSNI